MVNSLCCFGLKQRGRKRRSHAKVRLFDEDLQRPLPMWVTWKHRGQRGQCGCSTGSNHSCSQQLSAVYKEPLYQLILQEELCVLHLLDKLDMAAHNSVNMDLVSYLVLMCHRIQFHRCSCGCSIQFFVHIHIPVILKTKYTQEQGA